jgi:Cof subfamily protein (haloacid dehalogenase superfamily)
MYFDKMKIAFFDIDGTIFNHDERIITDNVINALKKLKDNGILICICTGRPYEMLASLKYFLDQIEFDFYITSNGQSIYEDGKLVYRNFLDKDDVQKIIKIAKDNNLTLSLIGDDVNITTQLNDTIIQSCDIIGTPIPQIVDIPLDFNKLVDHAVIYESTSYKNLFEGQLKKTVLTFWSDYAFEFTPDNGVKVHGIKQVLNHLNIDKDDSIAFGDGNNDVEMLDYVGFGVAMGNASGYVKEHADYVTDSIYNDGVVQALKKFNMI